MSTALAYRTARPADAEACVALRCQTRQNAVSRERLAGLGITPESWAEDIRSGRLPGLLCLEAERLVGYCFGDTASGEIVVLALLPDYEGQGIGRQLLGLMVQTLREAGHQRLFLGCARDPATRSHGFYRHLGWRPTGEFDALGDADAEGRFPRRVPASFHHHRHPGKAVFRSRPQLWGGQVIRLRRPQARGAAPGRPC